MDTTYEEGFYKESELNMGNIEEEEPQSEGVDDEEIDEASLAKSYFISADGMSFDDSDEDSVSEKLSKPSSKSNEEDIAEEGEAMSYSVSADGFELDEDDEEEESFSSEERLRFLADRVISATVGTKSIRKYALNRMMSSMTPRLFRDENYIIYSVLFSFRDRVRNLNIDTEFLRLFLQRNRGIVSKARGFIDIYAYEEVEGSLELGYISGVLKHFKRLSLMEDMSETEFDTILEKYLIEFKAVETIKVYQTGQMIVSDGVKIGNRTYSGFEDSQLYVRRELATIEGLTDSTKGTGYTKMSDIILGNRGEEKKPVKVADFDKLAKLNEYYGGIFTSMFYQILAPAKSGKSKLCARICHTAIAKFGTNVSVWAQEGGNDAWTAQMRAIHFDYTYNQDVPITERKLGVDQEVIFKNLFKDDATRDLEASSAMDLASNPDYGVVDFIDNPFNVETFIDSIDASVKENNSKIVILDYLQLIMSENGSLSERERIAKAYTSLLNYCKKTNIAVITPAQYKQSSIDNLIASKDTSSAEMRTSGGNSAEVIRTPDISIALWASTADLANNRLKILSVPSRFAKPFPEIPCITDLGTCQFISEE